MRAKTKLDQFLEDPDPSEAYDVLCRVSDLLEQDIKNLHATIGGFLVTARRRVGHNSREDEVSEAWNNGVERSFDEVKRAVDSAFVDLYERPKAEDAVAAVDVDKLPPIRVITTEGESCIEVDCCDCGKPLEIEKVRCGDCKDKPLDVEVPEGMEALTVTMCVTPDVAKAVRSGKFSGLSMSGGMVKMDVPPIGEETDDTNIVLAHVHEELQRLWAELRKVERLVHCGACHGTLDTHDGHCPIAYADAVEMRLCNRFVEAENLLDKLKRDLDKHKHSPDRAFLTYGTEDAERWHNRQHEAKVDAEGLEAFVPGLGTVRECIDCGCLVAGGPTRCKMCTRGKQQGEEAAGLASNLNDGCAGQTPEQQIEHLIENQKGFGRLMACMMNRLGVNEVEFSERQLAFVDPSDVWVENTTRQGTKMVKVKLQAQLKAPTIDPRD